MNYERFSAQDSSFLIFEGPTTHMHLGGAMLMDAGPLATPDGGLDITRIRRYIASRLHLIPRYRQRLAYTPIERAPIWVDDGHFNIKYHVRHASLPRPGDERQLKRLCGRIMSQQLDRGKPLWEAWIVEGLEGNRFALVVKTHHCMVDGIASVDLLSALLSPSDAPDFDPAPPWTPRPAPDPVDLLRDELQRGVARPLHGLRAVGEALISPRGFAAQMTEQIGAAWQIAKAGLRLPADTPLNRPIGPHRRFDWLALDLADVKRIKDRLGGTVNDVVITTVAGGMRQFLQRRGVDVKALDYRVVLPVNRRTAADQGGVGNVVSAWLTSLPIAEGDPRTRLAKVRRATINLKESKQALGAEVLVQLGEWVGSLVLSLGVRLTARLHPYHLIVTNVPGPQFPLYMLGSRMLEGYPQVPLFHNQGLGIALFSYTGRLCWGFNADFDLVPDLHDLVIAVASSFDELRAAVDAMPVRLSEAEPVRRRRSAGQS